MSLTLYYRECLSADTSIIEETNLERDYYDKRTKTYLSKDKRFAAMGCGIIPTDEQWSVIRNIIDIYIHEVNKKNVSNPLEAAIERLNKEFYSKTSSSHAFIVTGEHMFLFESYAGNFLDSSLTSHNPDLPFVGGSGCYAARVLINSGMNLSQQDFFKAVSYSDRQVSAEYTFIELKNVVGTPWYKKAKNER